MSVAPASNDFEGALTAIVRRKGETEPDTRLSVDIKTPRVRVSMPSKVEPLPQIGSGSLKVMFDSALQKTVVFVESEKSYVVFPTSQLARQIESFGPPAARKKTAASGPAKVTKTDKVDTVAGVACETWNVQLQNGERGTVCAASRDVPGLSIPSAGMPAGYEWAAQFFDGHHLPLRWIHFDDTGVEDARVEAEKVAQHTIDKAEFVVPANYRRVDLTQSPDLLAAAAMADKSKGTTVPLLQ
jgi:hypothetical protein